MRKKEKRIINNKLSTYKTNKQICIDTVKIKPILRILLIWALFLLIMNKKRNIHNYTNLLFAHDIII